MKNYNGGIVHHWDVPNILVPFNLYKIACEKLFPTYQIEWIKDASFHFDFGALILNQKFNKKNYLKECTFNNFIFLLGELFNEKIIEKEKIKYPFFKKINLVSQENDFYFLKIKVNFFYEYEKASNLLNFLNKISIYFTIFEVFPLKKDEYILKIISTLRFFKVLDSNFDIFTEKMKKKIDFDKNQFLLLANFADL